jgi:hypothetical protein
MFMRYHGSGVGHADPTEVEETENVEPEEAADNGHDSVEFNGLVDEPFDTEDEEDGVSDPGESSDEETANVY